MRQQDAFKNSSDSSRSKAWNSILTYICLKEESLAVRVNKRLMAGTDSSPMAKKIVGKVSSQKFNAMMLSAVESYNKDHQEKIFKG